MIHLKAHPLIGGVLGYGIVVAGGYLLLTRVIGNWQIVAAKVQDISYPLVAASFILILLVLLLNALGWSLVLRLLGVSLDLKRGFQIYYISGLLRYLPGSLWYVAGRAYLCQKKGVSVASFSQSLALEIAFILLSGFAVASPLSFVYLPAPLAVASCGIVLFIIILVAISPNVAVLPLSQFLAVARIHLRLNTFAARPHPRSVLAVYLLLWLAYGLAMFGLSNALQPMPISALPLVISANALAWLAGFAVFFVPNGLGVRETALAFLLSTLMPPSLAVVIALLGRLCEMSGEALCSVVANRVAGGP